jgi:hypothetical protein
MIVAANNEVNSSSKREYYSKIRRDRTRGTSYCCNLLKFSLAVVDAVVRCILLFTMRSCFFLPAKTAAAGCH